MRILTLLPAGIIAVFLLQAPVRASLDQQLENFPECNANNAGWGLLGLRTRTYYKIIYQYKYVNDNKYCVIAGQVFSSSGSKVAELGSMVRSNIGDQSYRRQWKFNPKGNLTRYSCRARDFLTDECVRRPQAREYQPSSAWRKYDDFKQIEERYRKCEVKGWAHSEKKRSLLMHQCLQKSGLDLVRLPSHSSSASYPTYELILIDESRSESSLALLRSSSTDNRNVKVWPTTYLPDGSLKDVKVRLSDTCSKRYLFSHVDSVNGWKIDSCRWVLRRFSTNVQQVYIFAIRPDNLKRIFRFAFVCSGESDSGYRHAKYIMSYQNSQNVSKSGWKKYSSNSSIGKLSKAACSSIKASNLRARLWRHKDF